VDSTSSAFPETVGCHSERMTESAFFFRVMVSSVRVPLAKQIEYDANDSLATRNS
jgi:hypothetical protein